MRKIAVLIIAACIGVTVVMTHFADMPGESATLMLVLLSLRNVFDIAGLVVAVPLLVR
jgi:hypothetical protein